MALNPEEIAAKCRTLIGDDGIRSWSETHADAWIGMLETHKRLTRQLESELEAEHGLSLSGVELLGRLAAAEGRMLRLTDLAGLAGLSVSRVSRITDTLELRGLVERHPCPSDARAKNAYLTDNGLELLRAAQSTHFAGVEERFFDRLEPAEVEVLASIFARFAPGAASDCT
jgi:DNA-binding MarR family transcriptional regulator